MNIIKMFKKNKIQFPSVKLAANTFYNVNAVTTNAFSNINVINNIANLFDCK